MPSRFTHVTPVGTGTGGRAVVKVPLVADTESVHAATVVGALAEATPTAPTVATAIATVSVDLNVAHRTSSKPLLRLLRSTRSASCRAASRPP